MRKLYEIKEEIANMIELDADRFVNGETGEIISREAFDSLNLEYEEKIEGVALGVKREDALVKAIDEEIKALKQRKEYHEKRRDGYKQFLTNELMGNKFETGKVRISWRSSNPVEITDISKISAYYLRYSKPEVNKTLLGNDLKAGIKIDGAALVEKKNIQVR